MRLAVVEVPAYGAILFEESELGRLMDAGIAFLKGEELYDAVVPAGFAGVASDAVASLDDGQFSIVLTHPESGCQFGFAADEETLSWYGTEITFDLMEFVQPSLSFSTSLVPAGSAVDDRLLTLFKIYESSKYVGIFGSFYSDDVLDSAAHEVGNCRLEKLSNDVDHHYYRVLWLDEEGMVVDSHLVSARNGLMSMASYEVRTVAVGKVTNMVDKGSGLVKRLVVGV